jgi:hypothetical protein
MSVRRSPLSVEELGARVLPSATGLPLDAPPAETAAVTHHHHHHHHALEGKGHGEYTNDWIQSGAGVTYHLRGCAELGAMARVQVQGCVHSVGFLAQGRAGGELTFSNDFGSVTIELEGPLQPGFSPLPHSFHYHVVQATGAYGSLKDQGTLQLTLQAAPPPFPGAGYYLPHQGTFALSL